MATTDQAGSKRPLRVTTKRCAVGHPPCPGWLVLVGGSVWLVLRGENADGPVSIEAGLVSPYNCWSATWPTLAAALEDVRGRARLASHGVNLGTLASLEDALADGRNDYAARLIAEIAAQTGA